MCSAARHGYPWYPRNSGLHLLQHGTRIQTLRVDNQLPLRVGLFLVFKNTAGLLFFFEYLLAVFVDPFAILFTLWKPTTIQLHILTENARLWRRIWTKLFVVSFLWFKGFSLRSPVLFSAKIFCRSVESSVIVFYSPLTWNVRPDERKDCTYPPIMVHFLQNVIGLHVHRRGGWPMFIQGALGWQVLTEVR